MFYSCARGTRGCLRNAAGVRVGWQLFPDVRSSPRSSEPRSLVFPPHLLALNTENVVRKVFVFCTFNKAFFKNVIALDGIVVLGQLTEKAVPGALLGMNL